MDCPNCGQFIPDSDYAPDSCPQCGNPLVEVIEGDYFEPDEDL